MDRTYETLLEENNELRKALGSTKELLERLRSDNDSLKRMHEDFKLHHERLKKECHEAQQRCSDALASKKETENYYENYVKRMKLSIEQRKKEFDEMQSKMIPPVDSELLRVKLVNEIEGPMRVALDNKQDEIMRLEDNLNEMNRKYELVQVEYSTYKSSIERELRDTRDRHAAELSQYFKELQEMQTKIDDPTDKEVIRGLKREREDLRLKFEKMGDEVEEVRKVCEALKVQASEMKARHSREIDEERNKARSLQIEKDRLDLQVKDAAEQVQRFKRQVDNKNSEILAFKKEVEESQHTLKSTEASQATIRDELNEAHRRLQEKDSVIDLRVREVTKSEREKAVKLKEDKEKLHKQLEDLEMKERELRMSAASAEKSLRHELDIKTNEHTSAKEDLKLLENRNAMLTKELDTLKNSYSNKTTESEKVSLEFNSLKERIAELSKREEQLLAAKQRLEESLNKTQHELGNRPDSQESKHTGERLRYLESQLQFYKNKARDYKAKVRQANQKLQELGLKLAHSELERQRQ